MRSGKNKDVISTFFTVCGKEVPETKGGPHKIETKSNEGIKEIQYSEYKTWFTIRTNGVDASQECGFNKFEIVDKNGEVLANDPLISLGAFLGDPIKILSSKASATERTVYLKGTTRGG